MRRRESVRGAVLPERAAEGDAAADVVFEPDNGAQAGGLARARWPQPAGAR